MTSNAHESRAGSRWEREGCPVCGGKDTWCFFATSNVPAQDGLLWDSREEATRAPIGEIRLSVCNTCLYIGNEYYEPAKVCFTRYDFSLQHSPSFRRFVHKLSSQLIRDHGLRNTTILDVGCGDAFFLKTICALGNNQGVGIEPGFKPAISPEDRVRIIHDRFSEKQLARLKPAMVSCRHVLNAVHHPRELLVSIRNGMRNSPGVVYLEVPNAAYTFGQKIVWNVVYEHRSWFLPEGLTNLCRAAGLEVLDTRKCWKGEYFSLTCVRSKAKSRLRRGAEFSPRSLRMLESFHEEWNRALEAWQLKLARWRQSGVRAVAWGAGARAVSFFGKFDLRGLIESVIDINPARSGKYLPMSGLRVEAPEYVTRFKPELVLITNPTYQSEIQGHVERMGVKCRYENL